MPVAEPTKPLSQKQKLAAAIGGVAIVVGVGLLLWGLAPAKGFGAAGAAFSGGPVPEDLNEQIDAALAGVMARAWASGLGLAGILGGVIALKEGMTRKEYTVEERVQQELAARGVQPSDPVDAMLEDLAPPAQAAPAVAPDPTPTPPAPAAPPAPTAAPPTPAPTPQAATTTCPTCDQPLIAGGRSCRSRGKI